MSSITVGSVGDIIAICLLAKQIVDTLDSSRGASTEYQALVSEIRSLEKSLLEVDLVQRKYGRNKDVTVLGEITGLSADCRSTLERLHKDIDKYKAHLSEKPTTGLMRQIGMKVRWEVSAKARVAEYRTQLAAHCNAINMLLVTTNVSLAFYNTDHLEARESTSTAAITEQTETLNQIRQDIHENHQLSTSITDMVRIILRRFDCFYQLCTSIKSLIGQGYMLNLATYKAVLSVKEALDYRIDRSLIQEPFILEDAMGRVAPVHLQFITSWAAFDAVLIARFEGYPGAEKVINKQFVLQERATRREIVRNMPWESTFRPGQSIDMSLVFSRKTKAKPEANRCPHCWAESDQICTHEVTCPSCGMVYQRITDVVDVDAPPARKVPTPWSQAPIFGKTGLIDTPIVYGPSKKRKWDPDDWQDLAEEITTFKRVRVVTTHERVHDHRDTAFSTWSGSSPLERLQNMKASMRFADSRSSLVGGVDEPPDQASVDPSPTPGSLSPSQTGPVTSLASIDEAEIPPGLVKEADHNQQKLLTSSSGFVTGVMPYDSYYKLPPPLRLPPPPANKVVRRTTTYVSQRSQTVRPASRKLSPYASVKPASPRQATEADARLHKIPKGYSLKDWNPAETPILLLGSVFDTNSLGKWIYDWTVAIYTPQAPIAELAGDLWLLLLDLSDKTKFAYELVDQISCKEKKSIVTDYLDSSDRLVLTVQSLIERCSTAMLPTGEQSEEATLKKNAGREFVDTLLGRDKELQRTEKFMHKVRAWVMRYDANVVPILTQSMAQDANSPRH